MRTLFQGMEREVLRSDEDVEEILRIAIRKEGNADPDLRHRLKATANELGISDASLKAAEQEYLGKVTIERDLSEYNRHKRQEFWGHFYVYLAVIAGLFGINFFTGRDGGELWAVYPMLGWGIGVACHGISAMMRASQFDKEFLRWRRKKLRAQNGSFDDDDDDD